MDIVSVDLKVHDSGKSAYACSKTVSISSIEKMEKLLSAEPFAKVTWATEVDMKDRSPRRSCRVTI